MMSAIGNLSILFYNAVCDAREHYTIVGLPLFFITFVNACYNLIRQQHFPHTLYRLPPSPYRFGYRCADARLRVPWVYAACRFNAHPPHTASCTPVRISTPMFLTIISCAVYPMINAACLMPGSQSTVPLNTNCTTDSYAQSSMAHTGAHHVFVIT